MFADSPHDSGRITFRLSVQIVVGLVAIAALSIASFVTQTNLIEKQRASAAEINVSGRQRMLSQRTALFALHAAGATGLSRETLIAKHLKLVELMSTSHLGLIFGDTKLKLPGSPPPPVAEMYYGPARLDDRVRTYIHTHKQLNRQLRTSDVTTNSPLLLAVLGAAPDLLSDLHKTVGRYVQVANSKVDYLHHTQIGILAALLLLLILEGMLLFRPMVMAIGRHISTIAEAQQHMEEQKKELQLILDSTGDGIITANYDGSLRDIRSAIASHWLGDDMDGKHLPELFFPNDSSAQEQFLLELETLSEDVMPSYVVIDQMHRKISASDQITLEFVPIPVEKGSEQYLLFVIKDITNRLRALQMAAENHEFQELIGRILEDSQSFNDFREETELMLAELSQISVDSPVFARRIHTLKGNTAIYGMHKFADLAHKIETQMAEMHDAETSGTGIQKQLSATDIQEQLVEAWQASLQRVERFLPKKVTDISISREEHAHLLTHLKAANMDPRVLSTVGSWAFDPVGNILHRISRRIEQLAKRVGKDIRVEIQDHDLRVPPDYLKSFWPSLIHILRNAVDHGIESAEERQKLGKAASGTIFLSCDLREQNFVITIGDDGPGINWTKLQQKAKQRGLELPEDNQWQLLFVDGLSAKDEITQLSGRGVGLSEVHEQCQKHGGKLEVSSVIGEGTLFIFQFPLADEVSKGYTLEHPETLASAS